MLGISLRTFLISPLLTFYKYYIIIFCKNQERLPFLVYLISKPGKRHGAQRETRTLTPKTSAFEADASTCSAIRAYKTHFSVPRAPASVGSSYHEFQKLTRLTSSVSRPVLGFPGKPIRVFVFSLFKTRILYKNRPYN